MSIYLHGHRVSYSGIRFLKSKDTIVEGINNVEFSNSAGNFLTQFKIYGESTQEIGSQIISEYQQVEYIESSGTQYIDTGYKLNSNCDTELVISDLTNNANSGGRFFGAWTSSTSNRYSFNIYNVSYLSMGYDYTSSGNAYSFTTEKTKLAGIRNKFYVNDVLKYEFENASFETEYTTYLFATHIPSNQTMINPGKLKLYSCKIWDNDVLVRNFIPCYRKSDNVAGLYDLVEDKFYTNAGTGTFLVGDNAPTPEAPIEIESVGDKTKNLINVPNEVTGVQIVPCKLLKGVTYRVSMGKVINGNSYYPQMGFRTSDNTEFNYIRLGSGASYSITPAHDVETVRIFAGGNWTQSQGYTTIINDFQIEEGSTATEYEPYGYKIPLVINGKNSLDSNFLNKGKLPDLKGVFYNNANYNSTDYLWFKAGTYTLSFNNTYTGTSFTTTRIIAYNKEKEFDEVVIEDTKLRPTKPKYTFTLSKDCYIIIGLRITDINIQIEKVTATTNIYLNEPLRKIGDYADYIDYKNKKVVRNVRYISLNVDDMNNVEDYPGWNDVPIVKIDYPDKNTNLSSFTAFTSNITKNKYIAINTTASNKVIFLSKGSWGLTQTEWKTKYPGLQIELIYGLQIPYEETIDIPVISIKKGDNTITINTKVEPSKIEVSYREKS